MRNTIINCTIAMLALGPFAGPAMADSVFVTRGNSYDSDTYQDQPGVVISQRGIAISPGREHRHRYDDTQGGCVTKSVTRQTEDGGQVTKTIHRCD